MNFTNHITRFFSPLLIGGLLFFAHISIAMAFEIIPLRHQTAEQIIPVLHPLLGQGDVMTGTGYKLIVKTSPSNMEKIRQLVQQLDTPLQQLIISVSHDQEYARQSESKNLSGHFSNDHTRVNVGRERNSRGLTLSAGDNENRLQASINQQQKHEQHKVSQQVAVLSGNAAFIHTGNVVPLRQQQITTHGRKTIVSRSTHYQDVGTGFYVTPRVSGSQVQLNISTHRQRLQGNKPATIDSQRLVTSIQGALGTWIEIGTIDEIMHQERSGILSQQQQNTAASQRVFVKVDLAPGNQFTEPGGMQYR